METDGAAETRCYCVCGTRCATGLALELHWARCEGDGRIHGLPPDERKRVGGARLLIDERTGRVLRAGCVRMPATSEGNESSTKSEGRAMREALQDVLPGLPPGWSLYKSTDSASWVESFERDSQLKLRRRVRKPDTGPMQAVKVELTTAAGRGINLLGAGWQPAEHNLPAGDDRRWHARSRASRAADGGAGSCTRPGGTR